MIVTPALAAANNGNWQTARRWQGFLAPLYPTRLVGSWPDERSEDDSIMIALHARRSADSIAAWHERHGSAGLAVVLTGTDLYRDIGTDDKARHSLALAQALVVLQPLGARSLPEAHRAKVRTVIQSAPSRRRIDKTDRQLRALMVGHLRAEKSPETLFAAARMLAGHDGIRIDHVGAALDPSLGAAAEATMAACQNYRWLGGLPHEQTRRRIQRAHVLIHASLMEGGAHVVIESVTSGTPLLASRIDGNVGLLGDDYGGYFEHGDAAALAGLLEECRATQPDDDGLLNRLVAQSRARAPLFLPETERAAVRRLVDDLL